mmetsp:Transcript_32657/g.103401  ORF Transcript_32657/g.103401 Transcript_32657/m.103401 type:complete len:272 (-) Transcript_32657:61-876(-)
MAMWFLRATMAAAMMAMSSGFSCSLPSSSLRRSMSVRSGVLGMTSKTIAVFGATGGVGLESVYQALNKGYKVKALARSPEKLIIPPGSGGESKAGKKIESPDLTVVQGDVTKAADVNKIFQDQDIDGVVVALGGRTKEVGTTMLTEGTRNIIQAMKSSGSKRVSIVTSIGAGDSYDQAPFLFKVIMWTILKDAFKDKNNQESLFLDPGASGKDLEFVIVRPGGLGVGPPTGQINVLSNKETAGSIARADVADFCLRALEEDTYLRKAVCIS